MAATSHYVLGFDYGSHRIGVAIGQTVTRQASPLEILPCRHSKPAWDAISRLIQHWQPGTLVVGLPIREDGSDSPTTENARRFMRQLEGRYHLPVHGVSEYLSSHEAAERLGGREALDAVAAQVILETWLSLSKA